MKLNFFFDLDGTLIPFGEELRESAIEAIRVVQAQGHRVFACTGRSQAELDPRLDVIHFDGGVYSAGGIVVLNGKEIYRRLYTEEERDYVRDYLEENGFLIMIQTEEGTYMDRRTFDFFHQTLVEANGKDFDVPNLLVMEELPRDLQVNKYLLLSPEENAMKVRKDLADRFFIVDNTVGAPQTRMAEICLKGLSKATGMQKILDYTGEGRASTVGIGDGANDLEMVSFAGLGVAMENATTELKAVASYITGSCYREGIKQALEYAVKEYLPSVEAKNN